MKAKNLKGLFSKLSGYGDEALDYGLDVAKYADNYIDNYTDDIARGFGNPNAFGKNVPSNLHLGTTTVPPSDMHPLEIRNALADATYWSAPIEEKRANLLRNAVDANLPTTSATRSKLMEILDRIPYDDYPVTNSEYLNSLNISSDELDNMRNLTDPLEQMLSGELTWSGREGIQNIQELNKLLDTLPPMQKPTYSRYSMPPSGGYGKLGDLYEQLDDTYNDITKKAFSDVPTYLDPDLAKNYTPIGDLRDRLYPYSSNKAFDDWAGYFESGAYLEQDPPEWWEDFKDEEEYLEYFKHLSARDPATLFIPSDSKTHPVLRAHAGNSGGKLKKLYSKIGLPTTHSDLDDYSWLPF